MLKKEYEIDEAFHQLLKIINKQIGELEYRKNEVFKALRKHQCNQKREV